MINTLRYGNVLFLIITIVVNYLSVTGMFGGNTISSVSAKYDNPLTPAGYTFSIWLLIYVSLCAFAVYQLKDRNIVSTIGPWFIVSCIANTLWVFAWIYDHTGVSVLIMLLLLFSLVKIIIATNMELDDPPLSKVAFVWWPFSFYSGWITIALFANLSAYLTNIEFDIFGMTSFMRSVLFIFIAVIINLALTWKRNMREFGLVGVWGLTGIAASNLGNSASVFFASSAGALILLMSSMIHAYRNRAFFPWRKR